MANKKVSFESNPIDDDFLAGIKSADDTQNQTTHFETRPDVKEVGQETPSTPATSEKKTLISAKVNETTLKAWKQFCLDYDLTLTDAIKRAMTHYIKDVTKGNIEI